jgi:two-component system NtrC family sensor kinase
VTLYLPRSTKPVVPSGAAALGLARDGGTGRILLVQDDATRTKVTIEMLMALGYEVVHVDCARAALDRLMQRTGSFDLLLADVTVPDGLSGLELARMVRARMPALPIILSSGDDEGVPEEGFRILRKPLPTERLMQAIRAELGSYPRIVVDNTRSLAGRG